MLPDDCTPKPPAYLIAISLRLVSSLFASFTVSTPFSMLASTCSGSAASGTCHRHTSLSTLTPYVPSMTVFIDSIRWPLTLTPAP